MEINLQRFGGRGAGGGASLGGGSGKPINIVSETDVWSYRHNPNNAPFVDEINSSVRDIQEDFPQIMSTAEYVMSSELGGADAIGTLGYFSPDTHTVALNSRYTDIDRMNAIYDKAGDFHPSRGSKTAVQAVAYHEMGHAVNQQIAERMGVDLDTAAKTIVDNAYNNSKGRGGTKAWAKGISGYATDSNAECIAEAISDFYCNGSKANSKSKAIVKEMKRMYNSNGR